MGATSDAVASAVAALPSIHDPSGDEVRNLLKTFAPQDLFPALFTQFATNRLGLLPYLIGEPQHLTSNEPQRLPNNSRSTPPTSPSAKTPLENIVLYLDSPGAGGIQRVVSLQAKLLIAAGYQVTVLCPFPIWDFPYELPQQATVIGLDIWELPRPEQIRVIITTIQDLIAKNQIDLVITHANYGHLAFFVNLSIASLPVRTMLAIHSAPMRGLLTGTDLPFTLHATARWMDAVLVLSNFDLEFWRNSGLTNVFYLPNPINFAASESYLRAGHHHHGDNQCDVLWLGRLDGLVKRESEVIRIFHRVFRQRPSATLHIVTNSKPTSRAYRNLVELVRVTGLTDAVKFRPSPANVFQEIAGAKVMLSTSRVEGFQYTLAEALQVKVPVVMYDLPYLEIPKHNPGIISVPWGDRQAAAAAVLSLLAAPSHRLALGTAGYYDLQRRFSNAGWLTRFNAIVAQASTAAIGTPEFSAELSNSQIFVQQFFLLYRNLLTKTSDTESENAALRADTAKLTTKLAAATSANQELLTAATSAKQEAAQAKRESVQANQALARYQNSRAYRLAKLYGSVVKRGRR